MTIKSIDYSLNKTLTGRNPVLRRASRFQLKDLDEAAVVINRLEQDLADLKSQVPTDIIDFFNISVAASAGSPATVRLQHNLGCDVRYHVLDVASTSSTSPLWPQVYKLPKTASSVAGSTSDENWLILYVVFTGTFTIRVEPVR